MIEWAQREKGLARVVAITAPGNDSSGAVLKRIGFGYHGPVVPPGADGPSSFYAWEAAGP